MIFAWDASFSTGRIEYAIYLAAVAGVTRGRKATKKCVERLRRPVLILYSKVTINFVK